MRIVLILCCCLATWLGQAQDYKKDFLQVYQNYSQVDYYTQEISIQAFAKQGDKKAAYEDQGKIVKYKNQYFSSIGAQKTIVNNGRFLHVNKEEKRMLFYYQKTTKNNPAEQYQMLLDSTATLDVEYLGSNKGIKKYLLKNDKQIINKVELSLDMTKKMVTKIVYHYQSTEDYQSSYHKTIINYKTDDRNKPASSWFDMSPYIHLKNNRASLRSAYQHYTLTQPKEKEMSWEDLPKQQ